MGDDSFHGEMIDYILNFCKFCFPIAFFLKSRYEYLVTSL
jgi:hypothetical protein